jgi:ribosomal protein S27E
MTPDPERKPVVIGTFRIGRFFCAGCNHYGAVVRDAETEIVCCPACGQACVAASGPDDIV